MEQTKPCLRCSQTLNIEAFQLDKRGRRNVCKKCRRDSEALLRRMHAKWREENPGVVITNCECCGRSGCKFIIDHCHTTGQMRGWLCHPCNVAIGNLGDTWEGVMRAITYLKK
jgi:hypothetical protein